MPDWPAIGISVGAAVALFKFKRNVIHVIAACALLGLLIKTLGW
jgi:chromate transporter